MDRSRCPTKINKSFKKAVTFPSHVKARRNLYIDRKKSHLKILKFLLALRNIEESTKKLFTFFHSLPPHAFIVLDAYSAVVYPVSFVLLLSGPSNWN